MAEEKKEENKEEIKIDDPEVTKEQLQGQLNYAQKIINVLQVKVNEANGKLVQIEAQLELANEDRAHMLKQLEPMGITPTE